MFIELLTAIGIAGAAVQSDASETTPTLEMPDPTEVMCLAENMYHEAKNQGTAGWSAVASVTFNRVKDTRFPNTVCEVVKQGPTRESWKTRLLDLPEEERKYYPIRHRCQFSWYCDGKSDEIPSFDGKIFETIYGYAELYLMPDVILIDITDGATHYHADYVFPAWRKSKTKTVEIGDHIFYRWEK